MTSPGQQHLDGLERLKQLMAEDLARPLKDAAKIIIPSAVDAHQRAAAYRRAISSLKESEPCSAPTPSDK